MADDDDAREDSQPEEEIEESLSSVRATLKRETPDDDDDNNDSDASDASDSATPVSILKKARIDNAASSAASVKEEEEEDGEEEDDDEDEEEDEAAEKKEEVANSADAQKEGKIEFKVVLNDNSPQSMMILTGCKMIFQKQLPKMPKEYITRLVYDWRHRTMALVKNDVKVIGAITYRPFETQEFAEIVFCAIHSDSQVRGFGSMLMNQLKSYILKEGKLKYFLTYADNYAVGYFKKQGFTVDVNLDRSVWAGHIKDYDGGTLMQCSIIPNLDYLRWRDIVREQRAAVQSRIDAVSASSVVHPPLDFGRRASVAVEGIAGLEGRWSEEWRRRGAVDGRAVLYAVIRKSLKTIKQHRSAWPFQQPVKREEVPDYYDVIKNPMDLFTVAGKVDARAYKDLRSFEDDIKLIFTNSKTYNEASTPYYKCAYELETFFEDYVIEVRKSHQQLLDSLGVSEK